MSEKNYTKEAIYNQLKAMNCAQGYNIAYGTPKDHEKPFMAYFRDENKDPVVFSAEEILNDKFISKLKAENWRGRDIYIKPANPQTDLISVDDVTQEQLNNMMNKGFEPALAIETSPNNYQVHLKLNEIIYDNEIKKALQREIVENFDTDPAAVGGDRLWRLAGFTNQKPKHKKNDKQPYVKVRSSTGKIFSKAQELLEQVKGRFMALLVEKQVKELQQQGRVNTFSAQPPTGVEKGFKGTLDNINYQNIAQNFYLNKKSDDLSKVDFALCCKLISIGADDREIKSLIIAYRPDLEKKNNVNYYIDKTLENAHNALDKQYEREIDRGGFEM